MGQPRPVCHVVVRLTYFWACQSALGGIECDECDTSRGIILVLVLGLVLVFLKHSNGHVEDTGLRANRGTRLIFGATTYVYLSLSTYGDYVDVKECWRRSNEKERENGQFAGAETCQCGKSRNALERKGKEINRAGRR